MVSIYRRYSNIYYNCWGFSICPGSNPISDVVLKPSKCFSGLISSSFDDISLIKIRLGLVIRGFKVPGVARRRWRVFKALSVWRSLFSRFYKETIMSYYRYHLNHQANSTQICFEMTLEARDEYFHQCQGPFDYFSAIRHESRRFATLVYRRKF